jgi:glycosyltransferase involved in cell wall biosynthesis
MRKSVRVSVIVTVRNEARAINRLLESLAAQTRPPDEVVIVDGGSTDGTLDRLRRFAADAPWPMQVLERPGANISQGRNAAIAAATGDVIVSTDAGVWLERQWLAELARPFEEETSKRLPPAVVAGFFVPDPQSAFEMALGATTLPELSEIRPDHFLPSSRSVAFRKSAWTEVGGYPEWLDICEDLIFDFRLRDRAGPFAFAPQAVAHFRPRPSLRAFVKQYFHYARGDGKADLWRKRHALRYFTYLVAAPVLLILGLRRGPAWWGLGTALAGAGMFFTPYRRLRPMLAGLSLADGLRAIAWVPIIRVAGDLAKMAGYPVGWAWRLRHRPPTWRG